MSLADVAHLGTAVSARQFLRDATAARHDAVDHTFTAFDLSDAEGYAAFLTAQARAFLPVEDAIERSPALLSVMPDWPERRRADALRSDLANLGRTPPISDALPQFDDPAALLGTIYVLEGSRLGGRMLERGVAPRLPRRFLAAGDSQLWRKLLAALEENLVSQAERDTAARAALGVFALFEKGARVVASAA